MAMKKRCFKCGLEKPLEEFYKHPQMGDGHLNKCKECTKKDVRENYDKNAEDPDYVERERARGRDKHHRLYRGIKNYNPERDRIRIRNYKERFPEKYMASMRSCRIRVQEGCDKHHWSYNEEHWLDIIPFTHNDHMKLHRYMIYDQERMMYRTRDGVLLDTKEAHLAYYELIKELP
jgi:hypothetical protein